MLFSTFLSLLMRKFYQTALFYIVLSNMVLLSCYSIFIECFDKLIEYDVFLKVVFGERIRPSAYSVSFYLIVHSQLT